LAISFLLVYGRRSKNEKIVKFAARHMPRLYRGIYL
jgi:hypothetical protein